MKKLRKALLESSDEFHIRVTNMALPHHHFPIGSKLSSAIDKNIIQLSVKLTMENNKKLGCFWMQLTS